MTDFRSRFVAAFPEVPADLDLHLDEFVDFERADVSRLASEDADLLKRQGMPHAAAPYLSFEAYSPEEMDELLQSSGLPDSFFPIGQNGSGDIVAIDTKSREVIYINHDAKDVRVFINSSLQQFAESLCIYQEHLTRQDLQECLAAIRRVDAAAVAAGAMWHDELARRQAGY
jgi:hypothetical protein